MLTTNGEWMPLRGWFGEFHRNLHLGAIGRDYSELAASWVWVIAGAGLLGFVLPNGPRRGALSELRPYEAALVIIVLAVLGYFAPLFGLSLVVFIAVDVVLGWWKTRFAASHRSAP